MAEDEVTVLMYEVSNECGSLARRARAQGYDTLGYMLDLAKMEAERVLHETRPGRRP
jgi:hypothetical protein